MKETIKKSVIGGITFFSTILLLSFVYAAVGSTWTSPDTLEGTSGGNLTSTNWNKLLANVNNLNSNTPQFLGVAEQSSPLTVNNQTFTDLPGTTVTFNLSSAKKVGMRGYGSVTNGGTSSYASSHCYYRFVVDGTPYGDATRGETTIGLQPGIRNSWYLERISDLGAGSHTIKIQMRDQLPGYYNCTEVSGDYGRARLFIETKN